jgi:hypothetical protein
LVLILWMVFDVKHLQTFCSISNRSEYFFGKLPERSLH